MRNIELNTLDVKNKADKVFLYSLVKIDDKEKEIWFATHNENEKYISLTNGDAFILFIFIYAVFENLEFKSKVPISKRLKFGLLEVLLPAFQKMGFKAELEQFKFEKEDETVYPEANAIGTAMSFGVDSFFTFLQGRKSIQKLNYLTLFNAGAFGNYGGKETERLFEGMKSRVAAFASKNNINFVWVDTNLNEIFRMSFIQTCTFRNMACVLMFQKLFKTYYYASGVSISDFALNELKPEYYDLLSAKAISTNSLEFHISGLTENRMEKTTIISKNEITYENLNVCLVTSDYSEASLNTTFKNCSKCFKCIRTMISLDIIGKLREYHKVFDLNIYKKNKNKYLAELLYKKYRAKDVYSIEIFSEAKIRDYHIPAIVYYYAILRIFQPIVRKIKDYL